MSLENIGNEVYIRMNQAIIRKNNINHREGIFHVSDLIEPKCLRNVFYSKTDPAPRMDMSTAKNFFCGNIVHDNSDLSSVEGFHEFKMAYNPVTDKSVDLEKALKQHPDPKDKFWYDIVIGTLDDLILINGEYVIADKKTKASKPETVLFGKQYDGIKPEHKSQLSMYRLMLNRTRAIDAKYGCIMSLDYADKFRSPKAQPFELEKMEVTRNKMLERLNILKQSLITNELPERTVIPWMCNEYCEYASLCFNGEGVDFMGRETKSIPLTIRN